MNQIIIYHLSLPTNLSNSLWIKGPNGDIVRIQVISLSRMRVPNRPFELHKIRIERLPLPCSTVDPRNILSGTGNISIVVIGERRSIGQVACTWNLQGCLLELCQVEKNGLVLLFLLESACVIDCHMTLECMASEVCLASEAFALEAVPVVVVSFGVVPDVEGK